ncbi:MAG: hypothetical protein KA338_21605, partial [Chloroflexi bacterium]|nr:hypothetical protein [Chloroflexota bacterium]
MSPFHHVPLTLPSPPGEGVLPSPNVGEGPGMRVSFLPFGKVGNNNCPTIGLPTKKGDNRVSPFHHVPLTLPSPPGEGVLPSPNVG